MFILTNISVEHNTVAIFDTSDGTNEAINLTTIADDVVKGKLRVYGIEKLNTKGCQDAIPIPNLGIFISPIEARKALSKYYQSKGYSKADADRAVGLNS